MQAKALFLAAAATLAVVGSASLSTPAEAGKRFRLHIGGGHHHHFRHRHWHAPHYVYSGPSCRYYYKKWKWTGSSYWKHKYFDCIS